MLPAWHPDRGIRRTTLTLACAAALLITTGAVIDAPWTVGIGVWAMIVAIAIELIYRP
ncbi:hypothetical protein ACFQ6Q_16360 [Streptomyces sp. NPDC056437]|uniref:hypothetical protein n=1 Tax=Streptomyces sp. NPDC056437 TaxID=3345816 RepID=UPI00369C45A6